MGHTSFACGTRCWSFFLLLLLLVCTRSASHRTRRKHREKVGLELHVVSEGLWWMWASSWSLWPPGHACVRLLNVPTCVAHLQNKHPGREKTLLDLIVFYGINGRQSSDEKVEFQSQTGEPDTVTAVASLRRGGRFDSSGLFLSTDPLCSPPLKPFNGQGIK